jgi:hypothetical protein
MPHNGHADNDWRLAVETRYFYAPIDGFLQTPSGGQPGTSSRGRPTFDELGVEHASLFDAELTLGWRQHEVYAGAQLVRVAEDATLDETLVSQANTFPAGSRVEADVRLDWYRAGYAYRIPIDANGDGVAELSVAPSAGIAVLAFDFQLEGEAGASVSRAYTKASPQLGADVRWRLSDRWTIAVEVLSGIPVSDMPFIFLARAEARYRLVDSDAASVDGAVGVGYERIQYDDAGKQDLPNDIEAEFGPMLTLGLDIRF